MAWLTLVMPSEAAKVSHKVHSIISSADDFSSALSEDLLISVCGVNEELGGFLGKTDMIHCRLYLNCFTRVEELLNAALCGKMLLKEKFLSPT